METNRSRSDRPRVAVVGAGIAGATCAHSLAAAGWQVQVVDKSRGPGGRLSTRRMGWTAPDGQLKHALLHHGAPGFTARSPGFVQWLQQAVAAGAVAPWEPLVASGSRPAGDDPYTVRYRGQPDGPALCRWLLEGVPAAWNLPVDELRHGAEGWRLMSAGQPLGGAVDAVVLALPPAQAAPLLAPHRRDWAQRASLVLMQPCWTLMGISGPLPPGLPAAAQPWQIARPQQGVLGFILREAGEADELRWVLHARAGWSRQHLEELPEEVLPALQAALQAWLGAAPDWRHAVVHRWRYAVPAAQPLPLQPDGAALSDEGGLPPVAAGCWWDAGQGLGVCGDFLGHAPASPVGSGGTVEGAWASGRALAAQLLAAAAPASAPAGGRPFLDKVTS